MFIEIDMKNDKLVWENLVTIKTGSEEYSSHIVRIYERTTGEIYFVFIQLKQESEFSNINWLQPTAKYSWGKIIMNYTTRDYKELRKILVLDNETPIYQIYCSYKDLAENNFERPILIPPQYRYRD